MARYTKDGKPYISVTQLINIFFPFNNESFEKWCKSNGYDPEKIMKDSTRMGTKVSEWIENAKLGISELDSPCTIEKERGLKTAVESFLGAYEVVSCEQPVYCDEFGYAGTYDMKVIIDGEEYLCDSKTYGAWNGKYKRDSSKIKKVSYQTSMYSYADNGTDKLALVVFKTDGTYEIEKLKYTEDWIKKIGECEEQIKLLLEENDTNTTQQEYPE